MKRIAVILTMLLLALPVPDGRAALGEVTCSNMIPTLIGTSGDDHLEGTSGNDVIVGLEGDDVIIGGGGLDRICGNEGHDSLDLESGEVFGGDGDDRAVTATTGYAEMGPGNDYSLGFSKAFGGRGDDEMRIYEEQAADLDGGSGNDLIVGGNQDPHYTGSEDLLRGGPGDDRLFGKGTLNFIEPGPGRDYVHMGWKRQTWTGGLRYPDASRIVADMSRRVVKGQGLDTLHGRITYVKGSPGDDILVGSDASHTFMGGNGDDRMYGRGGSDLLIGDRGEDSAFGGPEEDSCYAEIERGCP